MASQYERRKMKEKSTEETSEPNYDRVGYDIFRDENGTFLKVAIEYDLQTGAARIKEVKPVADSLPRAVQESQKLFVNKLMGIKGD